MMAQMMQDPEMMAAMSNPKVMQAMQQCMGNPMAMMQYMDDPEVGPVLQKLMAKMMGFTGFETSKGKEHEDAGGMSKKTKRRARQYMNRKVSGGGPPRSLGRGGEC